MREMQAERAAEREAAAAEQEADRRRKQEVNSEGNEVWQSYDKDELPYPGLAHADIALSTWSSRITTLEHRVGSQLGLGDLVGLLPRTKALEELCMLPDTPGGARGLSARLTALEAYLSTMD